MFLTKTGDNIVDCVVDAEIDNNICFYYAENKLEPPNDNGYYSNLSKQ